MQQEAAASKIKEENKEIRDEVEADLSMFYVYKVQLFLQKPKKQYFLK